MYDRPVDSRMTTIGVARKPTMIHLFGILYAREIDGCGDKPTRTAKEIAKKAGIGENYGTEIDKGRLLAEYVTVHDENVRRWRD
ncbi:MAG: hypothetical protein OXG72_04010 [Acidobacteria bacterium]|nr:hypothetical protein [Acidobacteriota bacterium]